MSKLNSKIHYLTVLILAHLIRKNSHMVLRKCSIKITFLKKHVKLTGTYFTITEASKYVSS